MFSLMSGDSRAICSAEAGISESVATPPASAANARAGRSNSKSATLAKAPADHFKNERRLIPFSPMTVPPDVSICDDWIYPYRSKWEHRVCYHFVNIL